jgi:hypothetical protein
MSCFCHYLLCCQLSFHERIITRYHECVDSQIMVGLNICSLHWEEGYNARVRWVAWRYCLLSWLLQWQLVWSPNTYARNGQLHFTWCSVRKIPFIIKSSLVRFQISSAEHLLVTQYLRQSPPWNTPMTISLILQKLVNQARVSSLDSYRDMGDSSALVNGTSHKIRNEISKRDVDITICENNLLLTNRHSYLHSQVIA